MEIPPHLASRVPRPADTENSVYVQIALARIELHELPHGKWRYVVIDEGRQIDASICSGPRWASAMARIALRKHRKSGWVGRREPLHG